MTDERPQFGCWVAGGDRDRRLLASLAGDALGAILLEPGAVNDKAGECLRQPRHQVLPRRGRKILAGQERVADRRNIAEPRAPERPAASARSFEGAVASH